MIERDLVYGRYSKSTQMIAFDTRKNTEEFNELLRRNFGDEVDIW